MLLRVGLAGHAGPHDALAGAGSGAALLGLALLSGWRPVRVPAAAPRTRAVLLGLLGALVLCALPVLLQDGAAGAGSGFARWALVVTGVALCQEAFFRGALLDALLPHGTWAAVGGSALAFGLMHVPLHGWHVLPLDTAVGVLLAGLRLEAERLSAPALAHVGADLATWWLR